MGDVKVVSVGNWYCEICVINGRVVAVRCLVVRIFEHEAQVAGLPNNYELQDNSNVFCFVFLHFECTLKQKKK
jgi:hypothetical protein